MEKVIEVNNLRKLYGDFVAVDGISFDVKRGEIFGIVGPNGAGKTTTVESCMGLRQPDGGSVRVLGQDPQTAREAVAQQIGIQLQEAQLAERIKVWEALDLFSSFYKHTVPWEPLLQTWGLGDKRDAQFRNLSGGQKQRLFITLALLNDPEVVFLDELTTGLDPQARRQTWDLVAAIRDQGKTVVLVTHFMDEAQALCDRVGIIDHGKMIALDTPSRLIQSLDAHNRVVFESDYGFKPALLEVLPEVDKVVKKGGTIQVFGSADSTGPSSSSGGTSRRTSNLISTVINTLEANHITFNNLRTEQPNLEDVFIALTGREIRA